MFPSTKLTVGQHASGNKKAEEEANKDAEIKLKEITEAGKKSGSKVVEDLIEAVITVNPEVPDKIQQEE
jgi:V-type H+-transporting ATPase subunit G